MFGVGLPEFAVHRVRRGPRVRPRQAARPGPPGRPDGPQGPRMANNARDELRDELGPEYADLELRDLDPRTIVRRHIAEALEDDDDERAPPPPVAASVRSRTARSRRTTSTRPDRLGRAHRGSAPPPARSNGTSTVRAVLADRGLDEVGADPAQHRVVERRRRRGAGRTAPPRRRAGAAPSRGPAGRPVTTRPPAPSASEAPRTARPPPGGPPSPGRCRGPGTSRSPTRSSDPATAPTPTDVEPDLGADRGHQPAGERDLLVLRPAAVGELDVRARRRRAPRPAARGRRAARRALPPRPCADPATGLQPG